MSAFASETVLVDAAGQREFRLLRCLGEGGFGEVYLAKVRSAGGLEQRVAVKLLRADVDRRVQAVERLRDEAAVLTSLHHPVILVAHDLVQLQDRIALVTEYVEGQDLRECMADNADPIPLAALVDVVGQVASALDAAWSTAGIVHRDIKPENIRIGRHGNVKLLDFGIAKSATGASRTQANVVVGSVVYLAPERFDRRKALTPASDVFALGCVLYEGIVRRQLFHQLDMAQMVGLLANPATYDGYLREHLRRVDHRETRQLLGRMLIRDPDVRIPSAEVPPACESIGASLPGRETLRTWCRTRRWPEIPTEESSQSGQGRLSGPGAAHETNPTTGLDGPARAAPTTAGDLPTPISGTLASPVVPLRPSPWRWVGAAAAVAGLATLLVVAVLGIGALGLVVVAGSGSEEVTPPMEPIRRPVPKVAVPVPVPAVVEPVREPVPAVVEPVVEPVLEVVEPVLEAVPEIVPEVLPVTPEPVVPAPSPFASVTVEDGRSVELTGDHGVYHAGDPIPPGTYQLRADFGRGLVAAGRLTVVEGQHVTLVCKDIRGECVAGP